MSTVPLKLNVYVRPSTALAAEAQAASDLLASAGVETFARAGRLLHATLFMTDFPPEALGQVVARAASVAAGGEVALASTGLRRTADGWVFLELERTPALVGLSEACAAALAPLRDPAQEPPSWMAHHPEKAASFARTGSPNAGDAFEPHFTLAARAPSELLDRLFGAGNERLSRPRVEGHVASIGLGEADGLGQIVRELARLG